MATECYKHPQFKKNAYAYPEFWQTSKLGV